MVKKLERFTTFSPLFHHVPVKASTVRCGQAGSYRDKLGHPFEQEWLCNVSKLAPFEPDR